MIRFEHVTITYPDATTPTLVDVSFEVPEGELVLREDVTKSAGYRAGLSEGEENREFTQAIRDTSTVFPGDAGSKAVDTETSQIITNFTGRQLCGQGGEPSDVWTSR